MFFWDIVIAFVVSLLMTAIFSVGFGRRGPWASVPLFLFIIFLAAWAAGVWLQPTGVVLWGTYWLPFLVVGLIMALLLALAAPAPPGRLEHQPPPQVPASGSEDVALAVEAFLWVFFAILVSAIVIHYLFAY